MVGLVLRLWTLTVFGLVWLLSWISEEREKIVTWWIWRTIKFIESSLSRQRRAPVGHQLISCLEWHGRCRESNVKGRRQLPIVALPAWCGVFNFTFMLNAWFLVLIGGASLTDKVTRMVEEGIVWALWAYDYFLKRVREPPDHFVEQRYHWFQDNWKEMVHMSTNLLGCQAVPWLDMGRQTWACLSWTRRPLQRVPWLRLSFLALLLVLWLGLPVPMQSAKTFEHKKVNGTSLGDLKVDKGATSHECFDTLPEFSIDPMLLDRNSFCQPCGSFPNQPEVWHTALSGEQKDQIGQAVQSALKAMPKEG